VIEDIKVPTLCISSREDPICIHQSIPVEKLYKNENIIFLLAERGGHIEYLSGWRAEWWGFKMALEYFDYFERQKKEAFSC